jgi:serine/threonine protein kinase
MDPVYTPPALSITLRKNSEKQVKEFLTERYEKPFIYDYDLGPNTYRGMDYYDYIYVFNSNGNKYLIKFSSDSPFVDNIKNEWNIYEELYKLEDNSFVLQGVDGGTYGKYAYLILPFVEAKTLREALIETVSYRNTNSLNNYDNTIKNHIMPTLTSVANHLQYMYNNNICHGDMHWDNVLLTTEGVKIIDFDKSGKCSDPITLGNKNNRNLDNKNIGNRKEVRSDYNFTGAPYNMDSGFFIMCIKVFEYLKMTIHVKKIQEIIHTYIKSKHTKEDIEAAYSSVKKVLANVPKGGRRTRQSTRRKLKRRVTSSK